MERHSGSGGAASDSHQRAHHGRQAEDVNGMFRVVRKQEQLNRHRHVVQHVRPQPPLLRVDVELAPKIERV